MARRNQENHKRKQKRVISEQQKAVQLDKPQTTSNDNHLQAGDKTEGDTNQEGLLRAWMQATSTFTLTLG